MRRALLAAVLVSTGCANHQKKIDDYRAAYQSDTLIVNRLLDPMGIEPMHGQVTVAVTQPFAQKVLLSSLHPNVLTVSVAQRGRVWKGDGKRLGISYDNGVWLTQGQVALRIDADQLVLDGDTVTLHTKVEGQGAVNADLKLFGISVNRDIELAMHHDEPLSLKLVAQDGGWSIHAVGSPLHAQINLKTPALTVAGTKLYELKLDRTLELPLEMIPPWSLPLPLPRAVKVGPQTISIGLQHYQLGAHTGVLWLGADVLVGDGPPVLPTEPLGPQTAPGFVPATPITPAPAPAPAAPPTS